jgi:hypothetical protein
MRPRVTQIAVAMIALVALALGAGGASAGLPTPLAGLPTGNNAADAGALGGKSAQAPAAVQAGVLGPFISNEIKHDTSPPLRSIQPSVPTDLPVEVREFPLNTLYDLKSKNSRVADSVVQSLLGPLAMPTPIANFEGMYNQWGGIPPDTIGDVGPYNYLQQVNLGLQVFSKTGVSVAGPYSFNDLFRGFGGICEANNNGDPVVLYDQLADRWFLSQFAFNSQSGPTYQCIAVSASGDPAGAYHRYAFLSAAIGFDDYPHYGMWPNAYYMTANRFNAPGFAGANVAYERAAMLTGSTARMVVYLVPNDGGALPTDLDGYTLPVEMNTNTYYYPTDPAVGLVNSYKFMVNWSTPIVSTFTGPIPVTGVTPWEWQICGATRQQCIPQPDTTANLEAISDRFMHRIAYRNMGTHEASVVSFTANATGTVPGVAGVRWMELRGISTAPTVFQQGTFAPNDGLYRWMGSAAMDGQGNIAIGYSASSETEYPSIRYAGRLATDPPGQLTQGEALMFQGTGSEDYAAAPRWGDYSSMNVDVDDCTFWYTTEYFRQTGLRNWRTRVGSFKFPGCSGLGATPTVTSTPVTCDIEFTDVPPTNTFHPFVKCLACRGIVSGYPCGGDFEPCDPDNNPYFRPNNHVTRGQLAKIVSISAGFSEPVPSTQQSFEDVVPGSPFWEYVERLYARSIIGGYQCGVDPNEPCVPPENRPYFRPNNGATRGQLTKIVSEAAGFIDTIPGTQQTFEDVPPGHTFWVYVERLLLNRPGVMSGYACGSIPSEPCVPPDDRPYFRPNNPLTRGQTSKIVANTFFPGCSGPPPPPTLVVPTATPTLCPNGIGISGSITMTDSVQTGRVGHGSPASQCAFPKNCAAISDTLPRHYDSYTYTNSTGTAQCVSVRVVQNCGDNSVRSIAYLGTYDPNNLCANYLADGGAAGPSYSYSFNLPAGSSAVVVLYENSPNIGCDQYHVSIDSCQAAQPTATTVPSNTPAATNTPTITPTPGACAYTAATATGTVIPGGTDIGNHCDDCFTTINLPFPVTVYGTPVSVAHVGSNGEVQLITVPGDVLFYWESCLPIIPEQGGPYLNTLFAYYDDLRTDVNPQQACADCGVFTQTLGAPPNRTFVIRWKTTYFNHPGTAEFEVLLTEGSGTLSVIYGASDDSGLAAASGIQRDTTRYTSFSCFQATLTSGLRVNYVPQNCGLQPVKQTGP